MPDLGVSSTWGQEDWAAYVLEHLSTASVLLRAGARGVPVTGRVAHIPRTLSDGTATWSAEGEEIASDAPEGDQLVLTPKKLANVVNLSSESVQDAPNDELDAVGQALTRSVAKAIDDRAFSNLAATPLAPAGLRTNAFGVITGGVTLDNITRAVGRVEAVGGIAAAAFINPTDLTTLRLVKDGDGSNRPVLQPDVQAGGAERISGALIFPTPALPAGIALVGDSSQIVVGISRAINVAFSNDAAFTKDSVVARVTARVDWDVNDERGLVLLGA